jgi:hypothetical protein
MGKSYLVSAMLSTPNHPFAVTDGRKEYNFIRDINPSSPNSTIEATGVITRFTTRKEEDIPGGYLKVQLLSISDIILILCKAFYNQVDYIQENILSAENINSKLENISIDKSHIIKSFINEDDILDIKEYLSDINNPLHRRCNNILSAESNFFDFLIDNINYLDEKQLNSVLQILWNEDKNISRLWSDMFDTYKKIEFNSIVYAGFDTVLKSKGTLLDVARLDEIYGKPQDVGNDYESEANILLSKGDKPLKVKKSLLSSLIAELRFNIPNELEVANPFLKDMDILDFPGARRPEQIKQDKLNEGKNLSTILRRGKVSYLFNKYSSAKRISTLLFCHNNNMSAESSMGSLLNEWIKGNVGQTSKDREEYVSKSNIPPLFIIGTWFNKDLEYHEEKQGDELGSRWNRRFKIVLEKEVLKSLEDNDHWFNDWTTSQKMFRNIYMLRDFKYSKTIYQGYDPDSNKTEEGDVNQPLTYPTFFNDLKKSFVEDDFVVKHFSDPEKSWNEAASCAKDGTRLIIGSLNKIAPNVLEARNEKFADDIRKIQDQLCSLLQQYYHPDNGDDCIKLAKRQIGKSRSQIDIMIGDDKYSFGRLMDSLMITEPDVYELVHDFISGGVLTDRLSNRESQIFMSAGLDSMASRLDNINRLCYYLGVDNEQECRKELESDGIDMDKLLSYRQMMRSRADELVDKVSELWHNKILIKKCTQSFETVLLSIDTIVSQLWKLYEQLNFKRYLTEKVDTFIENMSNDTAVGIISDCLTMEINKFSFSFGYDFMSEERIISLKKMKRQDWG